jgi:hypothetical protein
MASRVPLIQGVQWSWVNLQNIAFGVPVIGIVGIKWRKKQAKENQYGEGTEAYGRTYGKVEYEATITVFQDWWKTVCDAAPNKDPLQIAPFDWTLAMGNGAVGVAAQVVTLRNFEFLEDGLDANEGDMKLTIDIPCIFAGVDRR